MHAYDIIASHPHVQGSTNDALIRCLEECLSCAQACTSCADACLGEATVQHLVQCIRVNLDCADVCGATAMVASRRTGSNAQVIRRMIALCEMTCRICGEECARHLVHHDHCRLCAEACRRCEQACAIALRSLA